MKATDNNLPFWSLPAQDALNIVQSRPDGLTDHEAACRLKIYGPNTIKSKNRFKGVLLLLNQFKSPISLLLIVAALLSAGLGDVTDTLIILAIILVSGLLGFWQEKGAANAMEQLLKMVQLKAKVKRNDQLVTVPIDVIVPGDIVNLKAGDIIPGDCLLLEADELCVDEAAFTGESFPVEKCPGVITAATAVNARTNTVFMGAHVISGKASALVMQTGRQTEFGRLSGSLWSHIPETDFEHGIRRFGYLLMEITLLLVLIIFAVNVLLHKPVLDSFLFSLALAVGLTPQLLPAIISVNLSAGARQMAKQQVIVKRLAAIQDFGSMTVLCSDKTGTITEGKIKMQQAIDIDGFLSDKVSKYALLNASLQQGFNNPIDVAIAQTCQWVHRFTLKAEIPYDFTRKMLTVLVIDAQDDLLITKGAFDQVLAVCTHVERNGEISLIEPYLQTIRSLYERLSNSGLRVLGLAYKMVDENYVLAKDTESAMTFLGLLTFYDPPKPNINETITALRQKGIQLKIITGDNALVAQSVGKQIGLENANVISGNELKQLNGATLIRRIKTTDIFAAVEPSQKEQIIELLKKTGQVVGFMGDGINDAPALHTAHVGISVNTAVDVAKEAADIVLLSQDLNVLLQGITEGRKTFTNTMKYIFMATSANFGNMFSMAGASLLMPFLPLLPKQILLTNLLTDLPEMTIATDRVDEERLLQPQHWDLAFIRKFMIVFGLLSSIFDYLTFGVLMLLGAGEKVFQTGWFVESVISASLIVLVVRTRRPFLKSLPGKWLFAATLLVVLLVLILPYTPLASVFGFTHLLPSYFIWMPLILLVYILSAEVVKLWFFRRVLHFSNSLRYKKVTHSILQGAWGH